MRASASSTARSIALRSSRMLPGHAYVASSALAASDSSGTSRRSIPAHAEAMKLRASGPISPRRSRSGGITSEIPSSRK